MLTKMSQAKLFMTAALLFITVLCGVAIQSYASKADKADLQSINAEEPKDDTLTLILGSAEIINIEGPISDIMIADPSIVEVTVLQSNKLYIIGQSLGSTNLMAVDEHGDVIKRMNIHVTMDTISLQNTLDEVFPEEDVNVKAIRGQVILTGSVSTPDVAQSVQNLVNHFITEIEGSDATPDEMIVNLMSVRGKGQVMLRVKIMEVSRALLKERATDTFIEDIGGILGKNVENSSRLGIFGGVVESGLTETPFAAFGLLENLGAFGPIDSVLSLLEDDGLARILAEPNLTAISGEPAGFLAGGEFPVPSGRDSEGNIEILFRQFGVSLTFEPVVLSENRIVLQLETEVSSLARDSQVTLVDVEVPGLDVRRASTTVEMGSGQTLMIAGLMQSQTFKNMTGIPGLVDTPIIGDLMSSESFQRDETEMVVLVTPYLVEPYGSQKDAKKVPAKERDRSELSMAFSNNIRRVYGDRKVSDLFDGDQHFGYLID